MPSERPSPERAGGGLERVDEAHVGMALVDRAELAQGVELVDGRLGVARLRHGGVEHRRGVSLGEDEAVAVRLGGILRVDPHPVEEQLDHDLDGRERSARMAGFGGAGHLDDLAADTLRNILKF